MPNLAKQKSQNLELAEFLVGIKAAIKDGLAEAIQELRGGVATNAAKDLCAAVSGQSDMNTKQVASIQCQIDEDMAEKVRFLKDRIDCLLGWSDCSDIEHLYDASWSSVTGADDEMGLAGPIVPEELGDACMSPPQTPVRALRYVVAPSVVLRNSFGDFAEGEVPLQLPDDIPLHPALCLSSTNSEAQVFTSLAEFGLQTDQNYQCHNGDQRTVSSDCEAHVLTSVVEFVVQTDQNDHLHPSCLATFSSDAEAQVFPSVGELGVQTDENYHCHTRNQRIVSPDAEVQVYSSLVELGVLTQISYIIDFTRLAPRSVRLAVCAARPCSDAKALAKHTWSGPIFWQSIHKLMHKKSEDWAQHHSACPRSSIYGCLCTVDRLCAAGLTNSAACKLCRELDSLFRRRYTCHVWEGARQQHTSLA